MMNFDDELRKALARREPSDDFARRVLAQTTPAPKHSPAVWWRFASIAALLIVLFSAALGYREHMHRVKGEAAKEQLLMALRIAGTELRQTQMRVQKIEKHEAVLQ